MGVGFSVCFLCAVTSPSLPSHPAEGVGQQNASSGICCLSVQSLQALVSTPLQLQHWSSGTDFLSAYLFGAFSVVFCSFPPSSWRDPGVYQACFVSAAAFPEVPCAFEWFCLALYSNLFPTRGALSLGGL